MRFIGLSNTLLDDRHGCIIARALNSLSRWPLAPGQEPETLHMHRMVFQPVTVRRDASDGQSLLAEARLADVNLLLSHPNGPAPRLRGF